MIPLLLPLPIYFLLKFLSLLEQTFGSNKKKSRKNCQKNLLYAVCTVPLLSLQKNNFNCWVAEIIYLCLYTN